MTRIKLASYTAGLDPSGIAIYANTVFTDMTGNSHYPDATKYLNMLNVAKGELNAALNAAVPSTVTIKSKVLQIKKVLNALRAYVELVCNDDETVAASSGFAIVQGATHSAKTFAVTQGQLSGSVSLECEYAGARAAYIWEMAADPLSANTWQQFKITTSTVAELSGLTPGNKYWFRVKAIVKDKEQAYSDPYMIHVI
jgi:hypothetical protein